MRGPKTFLAVLALLEEWVPRTPKLTIQSTTFTTVRDVEEVSVLLAVDGCEVAAVRFTGLNTLSSRELWVDDVRRIGDGGVQSRQQQAALAADLKELGVLWEDRP